MSLSGPLKNADIVDLPGSRSRLYQNRFLQIEVIKLRAISYSTFSERYKLLSIIPDSDFRILHQWSISGETQRRVNAMSSNFRRGGKIWPVSSEFRFRSCGGILKNLERSDTKSTTFKYIIQRTFLKIAFENNFMKTFLKTVPKSIPIFFAHGRRGHAVAHAAALVVEQVAREAAGRRA